MFFINTRYFKYSLMKIHEKSGVRFWLLNLLSSMIVLLGFTIFTNEVLKMELNGKTIGETKVVEVKKGEVSILPES